jgi:two-component system CheB/CheR fusion protein
MSTRILLIDDQPEASETLAILLGRHGCDVRLVDNALQAVAISQTFQPDAICIDIGMPRIDGFALARSLRQISGLLKCRIVAVSDDPPGRERLNNAGIDMHLLKPVEPSVLAEMLCEDGA